MPWVKVICQKSPAEEVSLQRVTCLRSKNNVDTKPLNKNVLIRDVLSKNLTK